MGNVTIPKYPDYVAVDDDFGTRYYSRIEIDGEWASFSCGIRIPDLTPEMLDDIKAAHRANRHL